MFSIYFGRFESGAMKGFGQMHFFGKFFYNIREGIFNIENSQNFIDGKDEIITRGIISVSAAFRTGELS